jgi:hypothetical protein
VANNEFFIRQMWPRTRSCFGFTAASRQIVIPIVILFEKKNSLPFRHRHRTVQSLSSFLLARSFSALSSTFSHPTFPPKQPPPPHLGLGTSPTRPTSSPDDRRRHSLDGPRRHSNTRWVPVPVAACRGAAPPGAPFPSRGER